MWGSNPKALDLKSHALPTELTGFIQRLKIRLAYFERPLSSSFSKKN